MPVWMNDAMRTSNHDENLERRIDRALREQPLRHAPRSLEARVLAELARRAARPWWKKDFSHWPVGARIAFFAASLGIVKFALTASMWVMTGVGSRSASTVLAPDMSILQSMADAIFAVVRNIPSVWVYGGIALLGAMYAALFGISATAYRALYVGR
jgi:hypothetical protein